MLDFRGGTPRSEKGNFTETQTQRFLVCGFSVHGPAARRAELLRPSLSRRRTRTQPLHAQMCTRDDNNMYVYVYIYIYIYITSTYTYTHCMNGCRSYSYRTHVYTQGLPPDVVAAEQAERRAAQGHIYTYICLSISLSLSLSLYVYIYIYMYIYIYLYICIYVYIYIYMYTHMYIYTHV